MLEILARRCGSTAGLAALLLLAASGGPARSEQPPSPAPMPAAAPARIDAALDRLTAAVARDMKTLRLEAPSDLSAGRPARVVLTLPSDLLSTIRAQAAEVGLRRAARRAEVVVELSGPGYEITPDAAQWARLRPGEPAVFAWAVHPLGTRGGLLTADMTGALYGEPPTMTFALGAVTARVPAAPAAPAPAPARAGASSVGEKLPDLSRLNLAALRLPGLDKLGLPDLSRFQLKDLAIPGHRTIDIPGLGVVPSEKVVTTAILLLIVILLISVARSAHARRVRAERRRRFHTFEATTSSFLDDPAADGSPQGH